MAVRRGLAQVNESFDLGMNQFGGGKMLLSCIGDSRTCPPEGKAREASLKFGAIKKKFPVFATPLALGSSANCVVPKRLATLETTMGAPESAPTEVESLTLVSI